MKCVRGPEGKILRWTNDDAATLVASKQFKYEYVSKKAWKAQRDKKDPGQQLS